MKLLTSIFCSIILLYMSPELKAQVDTDINDLGLTLMEG